jgi:hypothetical protein
MPFLALQMPVACCSCCFGFVLWDLCYVASPSARKIRVSYAMEEFYQALRARSCARCASLGRPLAPQVALDCVRFCLNLTASFPDMGRSPLLLPLVIEMARLLPMYPSDEVGTGCKGCLHCCKDILWKFVP